MTIRLCGEGPPPQRPALSWAHRMAATRAGTTHEQRLLARSVVDLLATQPGLLRQLADETERAGP